MNSLGTQICESNLHPTSRLDRRTPCSTESRPAPLLWSAGYTFLLTALIAVASQLSAQNSAAEIGGRGDFTMSYANGPNQQQDVNGAEADVAGSIRTLRNAYGNAMGHRSASQDFDAVDSVLENATVRLSSQLLFAIAANSTGDTPNTLDRESDDLKNLTDMLSYAAGQLNRIGGSTGMKGASLESARVQSLEHLYRMTFAICNAYLDGSQRQPYLDAAREELELARENIQREADLCDCGSKEYNDEILRLSDLNDRLSHAGASGDAQ